MNNDIFFLPISGQDESTFGCYALVINDDIILFDAGAKQPYTNTLGIKKILPDTNWLIQNKRKIRGIFIGEPSSLSTDGLLYLVNKINPNLPIYVSELGKAFIDANFSSELYKSNLNFAFNYKIIEPKLPVYINHHKIIPFSTFSAIPLSLGFVIKNIDGDIVFLNDFIIASDYSKLYNNTIADLLTLTHSVKLLVVGVGNVSYSKGFSAPSFQIRDFLYESVTSAKGRVITCLYDHELYYLYALASVAKQLHKPFIVYSLVSVNVFTASIKLKLFGSNNLITLPISEIMNITSGIIVIVSKINELYVTLMDIVNEDNPKFLPKKDDLFILATSRIAGIEKLEADTIDAFTKSQIAMVKMPKTILPVKASVEDQKFLIKLLKPRYIVPINGLYRNFIDYENAIASVGIKDDTVQIIYNGEIFDLNRPDSPKDKISITETYVGSSTFNNEIDYPIIYEREKMSTDGFVNAIVLFKIHQNKVNLINLTLDLIGVVDRTFLESEKYKTLKKELNKKIETYLENLQSSDYDAKELKNNLKKIIEKYLEKQLNKKPLVLIVTTQLKS